MNSKKWLAVSVACFLGMVVLSLGIRGLLTALSDLTGLAIFDALSAGDLLNALGVFAGLVFAVWSYQKEQAKKDKRQREELEKAKPQIDCSLEKATEGAHVTVTNLGSKALTCFAYVDVPITKLLAPGAVVQFLLTPESVGAAISEHHDCQVIEAQGGFETEGPASMLFTAYDTAARLWSIDVKVEELEVVEIDAELC